MNSIILSDINTIRQLFKQHKIEKAHVFGSVVTKDFNENSDIDFLIRFEPGIDPLEKGGLWWNLYDTLRDYFNREIDLVTENSLRNPYFFEELNQTKKLIYG